MFRHFFLIVGILSVIILGVAIFYRPGAPPPRKVAPPPAAEQLELYMSDKMNYGLEFSRLATERRLLRIEEIAREHPELAERAKEVADTLRARLERGTVM